jgi:hypothetical protein
MKTQEQIELLANEWSDDYEKGANRDIAKRSYIAAYTQCQEDMAEDLEMHVLINEHDWSRNPQTQLKDFIKSLYKQD